MMTEKDQKTLTALEACKRIQANLISGEEVSKIDIRILESLTTESSTSVISAISKTEEYDEQEKLISNCLKDLGISSYLTGYAYLKYAIQLECSSSSYIGQITTRLYPAVAEKFETNPKLVERAIRYVIEKSWRSIEVASEEKLALFRFYRKKPTNSQFISVVTDYIKNH